MSMLKGKKAYSEIEEFEKLIKKRPDDDRAYVRLAELYARSGKEEKAIGLYEKAAHIFEKKGFLNKAKAVLKQALMLNPEHGKINVLLADYDRQSGLTKDALMRYQTAVNYYAQAGNKAAAINILRKIVELSPGNINFVLKLSSLLVEEKMYHEAEKLLLPLAGELKGSNKVNEYAATLKLLYTATDNDREVGKDLVNLYLRNSSYSNALTVLQKLIVDDPDAIEFLEKLAFVFEKLGNKQKLIATYKQIAVILGKKQSFAERDNIYRKILEMAPDDREALSALKEDGKLRSIISDKIEGSSSGLDENLVENEVDLVIDMDVDIDEEAGETGGDAGVAGPGQDIETVIKESKVFISYRLFNKAIDRIQSCREWKTSPEALDILIQAYIESGEMNTAGDLLVVLIDLMIEKGNIKEANDLLADAGSIVGEDDQRVVERKAMIKDFLEDLNEAGISSEEILSGESPVDEDKEAEAGHPELVAISEYDDDDEKEEGVADFAVADPEKDEKQEEDLLSDITSGTLLSGDKKESDDKSDFENLTSDILSELMEPPQTQLDELEFYISIEDFTSATHLLQELLLNYPNSRFLAGIKEIMPVGKEEDLAGTIKEVKEAEAQFLGDNADIEELYDMAVSKLTMEMFSEAISFFDKALDIDPGSIKCIVGLAEAWEKAGKPEKSVEILENAIKISEDKEQAAEIKKFMKKIEKSLKKPEASD